jgi:hypothetical protein
MSRLLIAAFAATVGLASVSVDAREVQLNDQERAELRQRAERIQQEGLTGRTVTSTDAHAVQHRAAPKAKAKAKAKAKKVKAKTTQKARQVKPAAAKKTS